MPDILPNTMNPAANRAAASGVAQPAAVQARASGKPDVMVPIRSLGENHRERIASHLMALDAHDRYLRFGFAANDEQIHRYVDGLDFERDDIFGIYNRQLELIAMAHLAFSLDTGADASAEFGVSVLKSARGRGYGSRLFERAVMHARNEGVSMLFIHALSENTAMLKIARKAAPRWSAMAPRPKPICGCRRPRWTRTDRNGGRATGADRLPVQGAGQAISGLPGRPAKRLAGQQCG